MKIDNGFEARQIEDKKSYTAYVGIWSEGRDRFEPSIEVAGSYYVTIAGGGAVAEKWGAGKCTFDDGLRAAAVVAALKSIPSHAKLVVFTKGLAEHVKAPNGHARSAIRRGGLNSANEPYDSFEDLEFIIGAIDSNRLELKRLGKRDRPEALIKSEKQALDKASVARAYFVVPVPDGRTVILATDDDPDPLGLMGAY